MKQFLIIVRLGLILLIGIHASDARAESGFLGIQVQGMDAKVVEALGLKSADGVLIRDVAVGEAGALSGLRRGDRIISFAGKRIRTFQDLVNFASQTKPGQVIPVSIIRHGKPLEIKLKTGKRQGLWNIQRGAFRNYSNLGFTVAVITKSIRKRFKLRWGAIGLAVTLVDPNSVIASGVKSGDVIVSANLHNVWHPDQLSKQIALAKSAGRTGMLIMIESAGGFRYSILPLK